MSKRESFTEPYEFYVEKYPDGYSVFLPHQCSDWEIVGADYDNCPDKETAVRQMELFVLGAQEALEKLKALRD